MVAPPIAPDQARGETRRVTYPPAWTLSFAGVLGLALVGCGDEASTSATPAPEALSFRAVSFNTGTTDGLGHDRLPDDGYYSGQAALSDMYYGNGLAWNTVVEDTRVYFSALQPDVVAFQELFYSGECESVPAEARKGFVCEGYQPGDPSVVQTVLGGDFQIACHLGKPDKCIAVRKSFGSIRGCAQDLCLDGLAGARVADCGGGSRVGRAVIDLESGGELTVVNVHGSSGAAEKDQLCRRQQFAQVFEHLDPSAALDSSNPPAANGARNLILGDLNTDPGRTWDFDESAAYFAQQAGEGSRFHFVTDVGINAAPTYGGLFNIDHIVSDALDGTCFTSGVSEGQPGVTQTVYFDHKPVVCDVELAGE